MVWCPNLIDSSLKVGAEQLSNFIYDFLTESYLFNERNIDTHFSKFSDAELEKELANYREFVLNNLEIINAEVVGDSGDLSVQTESFNAFLPSEDLLKQLSLYMDKVIINDPLFELTRIENEQSKVANQYFGMENKGIDREKLSKAINYMKIVTPMVAGQLVKFIPVSYIHEPPSKPLIYYSKNYFADALPKDLLEWFRQHAQVNPLHRIDNGFRFSRKEKLSTPCRNIIINFEGNTSPGFIYSLFETEVVSYDKSTGKASFRQWLPDDPPKQSNFDAWIFQSINRSADKFYRNLISELEASITFGCNYLTTSPFTSKLLDLKIGTEQNFETDIANLALNLEIPIIKECSIQALMKVRHNEIVFNNFRTELTKHLKELRLIHDPADLKKELENVSHELTGVHINQINNKLSNIKRSAFGDFLILAASFATTIATNRLSLLGVIAAFAKGYKDYNKYLSEVKQNPCYFLWKLNRE